jgi:phosphatidate phosphatase PAH1
VERTITTEIGGKPSRKIEHYWLCDHCSQTMRIGILENEALLIYSDPDGTITNTAPVDAVRAA